jgi:RimJ/RimL family protein N-acetyltransferase
VISKLKFEVANGEIRGTGVFLKPFTVETISDEYIGWLNNKSLMRFSEQRLKEHTRESCVQYIKSFDGSPSKFWSLHRSSDGKHIGTLSAYVNQRLNTADLSIMVGDDTARGTGAASEAWGLALQYLFTVVGVRKVVAGTYDTNVPMKRIMERHGMVLEGRLRKQHLLEGQEIDGLLFGIFKSEWENQSS